MCFENAVVLLFFQNLLAYQRSTLSTQLIEKDVCCGKVQGLPGFHLRDLLIVGTDLSIPKSWESIGVSPGKFMK